MKEYVGVEEHLHEFLASALQKEWSASRRGRYTPVIFG